MTGTDPTVEHQREPRLAARLRAVSRRPVVYAELPGAQHSFDVFWSIRFHAGTDAIVRVRPAGHRRRRRRGVAGSPAPLVVGAIVNRRRTDRRHRRYHQ